MPKRFTETEKWKDKWFRSLQPAEKLLFLYLLDNCNNAGFIEIDEEFFVFQLGVPTDRIKECLKGLSKSCVIIDGWLWIKNFLKHQKNDNLNPANHAHKQIISLINEQSERFKKDKEFRGLLGASEGLLSPIGIGNGIGNSTKTANPTLEEFRLYCKENLSEYNIDVDNIYHGYNENKWVDSRGKVIKNWKQKVRQVWCKPENKKVKESRNWSNSI